jgi:hypothetical protein
MGVPGGPGVEPDDYTGGLSAVSNEHEVRAATSARAVHLFVCLPPIRTLPEPRTRFAAKLWILWKTQDSRAPHLWITARDRLLDHRPSDRIGSVPSGAAGARITLKTARRTADRRIASSEPPCATRVFHTLSGDFGGIVVHYPQNRPVDGFREASGKARKDALHALPSVLAPPGDMPGGEFSTDVERPVDDRQNRR